MQLKYILKSAKDELKRCNIATAELDAELLLAKVLEKDRLKMLLDLHDDISPEQLSTFQRFIKLRTDSMPVEYITNERGFWKDIFYVDQRVLIPRPESEAFIELTLKYFTDHNAHIKVLDLGCGSGCLGISVLKEYPNAICVFADMEVPALEVAMHNALEHGVNDRAIFIKTNWFSNISDKNFDLILSNPPYIDRDEVLSDAVVNHEPHTALFASNNGLQDYIEISKTIDQFLLTNGIALFEIGYTQLQDVLAIFQSNFTLEKIEVFKDISGIDRCIAFRSINKKSSI